MIHGFVHEDAIENAAGIDIEAKRNIADAENGFDFWQFFLDALNRLERLNARASIFLLPGGNRQSQGVKNQINRTNSILVDGKIVNPMRDASLLLRSERHP